MKPWLRQPIGLFAFAVILSATVAFVFVGCRGDYTGLSVSADFFENGATDSFFTAIQVDPRSEDSAGPRFVVADDLNGDGLIDLVSSWSQSQPIQIHIQRPADPGEFRYETISLADTMPMVSVAGLKVADFDGDGHPDIAVLVKSAPLQPVSCLDGQTPEAQDSLHGALAIYFGPDDPELVNRPLAWEAVPVNVSLLAGSGAGDGAPEEDGYTSFAIGDMDGDGDMDLVTAWNTDCGSNQVLLFTNQGPGAVRDGTWSVEVMPNPFGVDVAVKDVALVDVDRDGDLDIIATRPEAEAFRIHWFRNPDPDNEIPDDFHITDGLWQIGSIAQIDSGADIVRIADIDLDGIADIVVRSSAGKIIQWLKGPPSPTTAPLGSIAWQVYTLAEFRDRTPHAIAVGDITGDGRPEVIASAAGGLVWFDSTAAPSVFDQWIEHRIIDDESAGAGGSDPATTDPNVSPEEIAGSTFINSILLEDLDGDGAMDLVVTLDRSGLSGLSNDAIAWFKSTLR